MKKMFNQKCGDKFCHWCYQRDKSTPTFIEWLAWKIRYLKWKIKRIIMSRKK